MNGSKRISELIESAREQLMSVRKTKRVVFNLTPIEFKELFLLKVNISLAKRNNESEFIIDDSNKEIINQLYYYFVGSSQFNGDLYKGIFLGGTLGTGKTLIMTAFCEVWNSLEKTIITKYTARDAADLIIKKIPEFGSLVVGGRKINHFKAPIYIDDMGKEPLKVIDYGTEICPMNDLLSRRYDEYALTFATGNYNLNTLKDQYGETVTDRMKEMFNIIVLKGNSRRK